MADKGPVPARSEEKRRRNAPEHPIWKLGPEELKRLPFDIDLSPTPPELPTKESRQAWKDEHPRSTWGQQVVELYEAIKRDPMVTWMTSADWAAMMIFLEDLDRELKPQVVGISEVKYDPVLEDMVGGDPVTAVVPMKGASKAAVLQMLKTFGIGEANRLRIQKEVTLFSELATTVAAGEGDIAESRLELLQGGRA